LEEAINTPPAKEEVTKARTGICLGAQYRAYLSESQHQVENKKPYPGQNQRLGF
jgi:hypothetical protein